ncbi:transcription elongation factor GreA [Candidatus Uhrbacteria bacterium]|nr:transcription elongation factor GreA [Candidatus Uhrbacteria bacterium]
MPTFISSHGLEVLREELQRRKTAVRRDIASKLEAAKELGDISENFEYHEAKDQQALNETRIVELTDMLKDVVLVEEKRGGNIVSLGTRFVVELNGQHKTYEIVGSQEANPLEAKISNESPLGQALLGLAVGEMADVQLPSGSVTYRVIEIL